MTVDGFHAFDSANARQAEAGTPNPEAKQAGEIRDRWWWVEPVV